MARGEAQRVRILVDVHEEQSGIPQVLSDELETDVEIASLPAGDERRLRVLLEL